MTDPWSSLDLRQTLVQLPPRPWPRPCRIRNNLWATDAGQQTDLTPEGGMAMAAGATFTPGRGWAFNGNVTGAKTFTGEVVHAFRAHAPSALGLMQISYTGLNDRVTLTTTRIRRVDGGVNTDFLHGMTIAPGDIVQLRYLSQTRLVLRVNGRLVREMTAADLPNAYTLQYWYLNDGVTPFTGEILQRL